MKNLQMQLEQIREDTAECLLNSKLAANGKSELFATLPENLDALALHVEETISANDERMARSRRVLLWSLAIVLTTIAGAAFFWANNDIEKDSSPVAIAQSRPEPSPAPRTDGEAAIGLPISIYQEDRKILTEQLSALAARVETLERTLGNLEKARSEIAGPSNKQSVGSEQDPLLRGPSLRLWWSALFLQRRNAPRWRNQLQHRRAPATRSLSQLNRWRQFQFRIKLSLTCANGLSAHPAAHTSGPSIRSPGPTQASTDGVASAASAIS
jgi:hypothetical protein